MNPRAQVVVTDFICDALAPEKKILGDLADVVALDKLQEEDLWPAIDHADTIMLYHNLGLTAKTIARLTRCKLIVRCGAGYDNVDRACARARGIAVANVPDYGSEEVADSAIGLALTLTRGIHLYNSRLRQNQGPWMYAQAAPLRRLRGSVFAIVGLGRIGSAAALRAKSLGMDVVYFDPYKPDGYDKGLGIRQAQSLEELLAQALVLSLHCPLSAETRHLINADTLALMPPRSYLINTARGAIVDTAAIPQAIASGQLAGAGIDVLEAEPARPDDPLVRAWRDPTHPCHHQVVLNPHAAFYSEEGLLDMRIKGSHACRRAILGQPLRNVVN